MAIGLEQLGYSVISHAELYFGAYNSAQKDKNLLAIQVVSKNLALVNFNAESAQLFGMIKADLKQQGNIILDADIMIAAIAIAIAIAIANKLTLVTNNEKHFIRIPNLSLENWTKN